ncbi:hypothetical protein [Aquisalinus flavus]|uniref:Uncharacterized protein n=1 Tax=Aquisalinus flavus TaxID=1526572 RepID=A0A8J2V5T1_9PROT|nr:hypothetical protein [Aquisalinus flavus]MBD0425478.1 hypothetical protein [Aquisalinus flavus]UNE48888.1 hypothetical protein FF099_12920 [Aquisalinus flavus]GGD15739.1 hypothetical protein GCM10011342_25650 [Aquisalinus flavus]
MADPCLKQKLSNQKRCVEYREDSYRQCAETGTRERRECAEYATNRRRECTQQRDDGYRQCNNWEEERKKTCSNLHPLFAWVCIGWTWVTTRTCKGWNWVSNMVCVAWTTIEETFCKTWSTVIETFCKAYEWVSSTTCVAWEEVRHRACQLGEILDRLIPDLGISGSVLLPFLPRGWLDPVSGLYEAAINLIGTVLHAIAETIDSTVGVLVDAIAWLVSMVTLIPVLGPAVAIVVNFLNMLVFTVIGMIVELPFALFGARPEKKLRVCLLLPEYMDTPMARTQIIDQLDQACRLFWAEARVRIVPAQYFQYRRAGRNAPETPDNSWINVVPYTDRNHPQAGFLRDVPCPGGDGSVQEFASRLFLKAHMFQYLVKAGCLRGFYRSIIGPGPSIKIIIVENHDDLGTGNNDALGCALGAWLQLYATVNNPDPSAPPMTGTPATANVHGAALPLPSTTAHELGHVCMLWHTARGINNLMSPGRTGNDLTDAQVYLLRSCRATYYF